MEIKFRWLSIHWGFVYWYYAYTSKFSNRNDYFKNVIITKDWDFKEIEEWTQALFTWLFDREWKGIYIWDMIQHQQYLYQVVWNFCEIWFKQVKTTITDFSNYTDWWECLKKDYWKYFKMSDLFNFDSCEIIWNIYQNKDLLNNN